MHELNFRWGNFLGGGLLLLLIAGFLLFYSGMTIVASLGQVFWQQTEARVTEAFARTSSGTHPRTSVHFRYVYQVNGREYSSHRYSLANVGGAENEGVKQFNEGDRITIYYDPENPSMAVVEKRRAGIFVYVIGALGIYLGLMAGGLMFGDAYLLFYAEGRTELFEHLTKSEQKALRAISSVADQHDAEALAEALQGALRRETINHLKRDYLTPDQGLWGAAMWLAGKTGIDFLVAKKVVERIAEKEEIELADKLKEEPR
jgi:hypothetical protein